MRYHAIYRDASRIVEVIVNRPNAPARAGMSETPTGRTWPATPDGERAAKRAVAAANGCGPRT